MMLSRRRRLGFGRVLAALLVLLGSTEALAHQHPLAPEPHAHTASHGHGPDCDHSRAALPFDEPQGPPSDHDACSVCWAGAGKALAAPPLLPIPPPGVAATNLRAPGDAPHFKKVRAAFEARGPPAAAQA